MPSYKNFLKKNESRVWNSLKSAAPKNSLYFPTPEMFENYPDPFSRDYFSAVGFYELPVLCALLQEWG